MHDEVDMTATQSQSKHSGTTIIVICDLSAFYECTVNVMGIHSLWNTSVL